MDIINNVVNFSNPTINSFDIGSNVLISIPRLLNGKFINDLNISLGFSKIGSVGLKADNVVRINYINNTDRPKTLNFIIELQY